MKGIPEGYHTITPVLSQRDTVEAIRFYQEAFGAEELEVFSKPEGTGTIHATIRIGDSIVMMGDEAPEQGCQSALSLGASPISLYVYVEDVDAVFARAISAGATETMAVWDAFWGDRCGGLKDPFGYSWMIATHVRDVSEEELLEGARACYAEAANRPS